MFTMSLQRKRFSSIPLKRKALWPFVGIFLFASCAPRPVSRHQETVLGFFNEVVLVGKEKTEREKLLAESFAILRDIEKKTSLSVKESEIFLLNQSGFPEAQNVSPEIFGLIKKSVRFHEESSGAFDITVLPLIKLWGFHEGKPAVPEAPQIEKTLPLVASNLLFMDDGSKSIGFKIPGMGIDLHQIVRGYACDRIITFLKSRSVPGALVNVGGTVRAYGQSQDGKPWRVGLIHPRDPTRTFKVVTLVNEAVSTRGDYDRFFVVDGRRYSDIINPRTGYPPNSSVSVSVIAPSAMLSDVLATALFILGPEKASFLANRYKDIRWYLIYLSEGERFKTLYSEPAP